MGFFSFVTGNVYTIFVFVYIIDRFFFFCSFPFLRMGTASSPAHVFFSVVGFFVPGECLWARGGESL